jgi:hypothetical protein
MSGAMPPLPQYVFMAWCLVRRSRGTSLLLLFTYYSFVIEITAHERDLQINNTLRTSSKDGRSGRGWKALYKQELRNVYASTDTI